jgi:DNA-binding NtrC family response regulator
MSRDASKGSRGAAPETLSSDRGQDAGGPGARAPYLIVAVMADDPLAAPARHRLSGLEAVALGRGERREVGRERARLALAFPDGFLSSQHARLRAVMHRWMVEDRGSRNNTFVNGVRVREMMLQDGDVIQVGHTFLVFRVAPPDSGPDDLDGASLDEKEPGLATLSPALGTQITQLERVARSNESILIGGETGTGKELIARAVHALSRRSGPFVAVNCGALPEALAEAELFGHRRGAFSGAVAERTGYVRAADGGTLFLDEIADLRPPSQAALLRVLQERQVVPLGAERPLDVDVRFCAATHRALVELVAEGRFRGDLHARVRGFELRLPPLRERREDLGLLVRALLRRRGAGAGIKFKPAAVRALFAHAWPDNVRELDQALGTALALSLGDPIDLPHLPAAVADAALAAPPPRSGDRRPLRDEELDHRAQLVTLLREHRGNVAAICRVTGKGRQQIHRWLKRYALDVESFRR